MGKDELAIPPDFSVAFVLGGGNALGAYHFGACDRLLAAGLKPAWLVGASIGAVTAAILAGNPPETRMQRLGRFWEEATQAGSFSARLFPEVVRSRFNNDSALAALALGRPGLFGLRFPGFWSLLPGMPPDRALRDHRPLRATLERMVDFDRLNSGEMRVSICSIDIETGDEVWFDTREGGIAPDHLLASAALAPLFPPVEIEGRLLCDSGFGNNLPLDRVFAEPGLGSILCFAMDPYHLGHGRPETLDQTLARVQDISFAMQTHRTIAALSRERELMRKVDPASPSAILAHLAYRAPGHQRTLKPLDFSRSSLEERIASGRADAETVLGKLVDVPRDAAFARVAVDTAPERRTGAPLPGSSRRPHDGRPTADRTVDDAARR